MDMPDHIRIKNGTTNTNNWGVTANVLHE